LIPIAKVANISLCREQPPSLTWDIKRKRKSDAKLAAATPQLRGYGNSFLDSFQETTMIKSLFANLANKEYGDPRRIEDFAVLFGLEIYTSAAGGVGALLWYLFALSIDPKVGAAGYYFALIALAFALIVVSGIFCGIRLKYALAEQGPDAEGNHPSDRAVRYQIVALTCSNTLVFGILVGLTGGALSAFLPLYAMTFTLTISETRAPYPTSAAFFFFATVLALACYLYWLIDVVPKELLTKIYNTDNFYFIFAILSLASLAVPYTALLFSWYSNPHNKRPKVGTDNA
jgi:hypothetical protein